MRKIDGMFCWIFSKTIKLSFSSKENLNLLKFILYFAI